MTMSLGSIGGSTQVSLSKMYQAMFKKVDQNGDGKIDKTEFASVGKQQDTSKVDEMFGQIDTDADGAISEAESEAFLTKMERDREARTPPPPWNMSGVADAAPGSNRYAAMFKKVDQNGDGKIDKTEFASVGKQQDTSKVDEMFGQIDTDADGAISEAESEAFLTKMEETRESSEAPAGPPPPPDWQTSLLATMFAKADSTGRVSDASMTLYA